MKKILKEKTAIVLLLVLFLVILLAILIKGTEKNDDWVYKPEAEKVYSKGINKYNAVAESAMDSTMGFSTGGAKDINNFRENLKEGFFPIQTDITYEGLFYDYYFDTKTNSINSDNKNNLFYPSASTAISKDPVSGEEEYYVTVGLNSNIKKEDFSRKKLNIVVVLDISGSMTSPINNYYYDGKNEENSNKSKMQLANESLNVLIDQLKDDDSLGIVLFDDESYLAKPLNKISDTNIEEIKKHVLEIDARGGTNFEAGYTKAQEVFNKYGIGNPNEYENRIIVITDAMPNIGTTSTGGLLGMMKDSQVKGINTTFIGVGLDFNSEVVKNITNVRGANYYKVSSEEEFKEKMGKEFDYMVTPMIYDLNMYLDSKAYEIEKIYGTDDIDSEKSNQIMHVNTLFPSEAKSTGEVKGGVILLKLKKVSDTDDNITLRIKWQTPDRKTDESSLKFQFKNNNDYYDNTGIRKAIVLTRYTNTIKDWIAYERDKNDRYLITLDTGILDYNVIESENERISIKLSASNAYKDVFKIIRKYIEDEKNIIKDESMSQELEMIDYILNC